MPHDTLHLPPIGIALELMNLQELIKITGIISYLRDICCPICEKIYDIKGISSEVQIIYQKFNETRGI